MWQKFLILEDDLGTATEQLATTVVTTQLIYGTVVVIIIITIKIQLSGLLKFTH